MKKIMIVAMTLVLMSTVFYGASKSDAKSNSNQQAEEIVLPDIYITE